MQKIRVIDSHTGGEPTRVVVDGAPAPSQPGALAARDFLAKEADWIRTSLICEPRGFDAMVGAYLCEPNDPTCVTGVVFFNNVSYLSGCLHGSMGVVATLAFLKQISPGEHRIETPSGVVTATLHPDDSVTITNVPSYRHATEVKVEVPDYGTVTGDISWGGNWFFLISGQGPKISMANLKQLTEFTSAVRESLERHQITGANHEAIDHVEMFGEPADGVDADSQNFVLCPGLAYDRSPCGTGTSAKLACLEASGDLTEGESWKQAGIIGTVFEGIFSKFSTPGQIIPSVTGKAFINGDSQIIIDPHDPFRHGISQ